MSLPKPKKPEGQDACDPARIRAAALKFLARREHSAGEITAKLVTRGYHREVVASVVAALAAEKLLSDARFVEEFVASRVRRGSGPVKIREELRGRGVDESTVEAALADHAGSWAETAAGVRRKRFGAALPRDYSERARQARFLQQRGFSTEQIRRAMQDESDD